jgi:hypothetical protein
MASVIFISVIGRSFSARVICRSPHQAISGQTAMATPVQWYRESANRCANRAEQSLNPFAKAAYRELLSGWLLLIGSAEHLAR